jgi:tetratricopeptide (TPR) repeat protein
MEPANNASSPTATANSSNGKIAITTSSEEARKEYLAGRDLQEKLRITDSIQHFDKAISLDPNFALAELNRANVSPTAKEFFDHLKKAVALSDKASDGERMLIQANEAGANANPSKQKEILEKLVAAYPNDERAHFNLGWLLLRPAGLQTGNLPLQTLDRVRSKLLHCFQHSRVRVPAG